LSAKFLGVPVVVWGVAALVLAVVWVIVWPADKAVTLTGFRFMVLRWGHALVWLLLGLAAFAAASASTARFTQPLALVALGVYAAFMYFVVSA